MARNLTSTFVLSRREHEVADLVSGGLTNREIAARLFLSERTVEGHVAQICNKLGFHSRLEVATWVVRQNGRLTAAPDQPSEHRPTSILPPWWILGLMAAGAPLPIVAAAYEWTQVPATGWPAGLPNVVLAVLALLYLAIPIVAMAGLVAGRSWGRPVAIGGLLALGSAVLLVAGTALVAAAWLSPAGFRAADTVESLYAVAVAPLLLVHIGGGIAIRRGHPWGKPLTTAACGFWILRFGYGLTLGALVLWLLWSPGTKGRGTSR